MKNNHHKFKIGDEVKITKLASVEKYVLGSNMDQPSLFVDYTVEGILTCLPDIGNHVRMFRKKRNGIEIPGYFETSKVVEVSDNEFKTRNSVYKNSVYKIEQV